MKNEKYKLVDPLVFKNHVRTRYLELAALMKPEAFEELRNKISPIYLGSGLKDLFNPFIKTDYSWEDFERGKIIDKKLSNLRKKLISWQKRLNLVEVNVDDKWVLKWLVINVLGHWDSSHELVSKWHLFQPINHPSYWSPPAPSFTLPDFVLSDQLTNIQYVGTSTSEYISNVLKKIGHDLKRYCEEVEQLTKEMGWVTKDEVSIRDLFWTVQSQILEDDFSDIANLGKVDISGKYKDIELLNPLELNFEDIDIYPVDSSTVLRAVEKTLNIIGIKPRKRKKGRPFGDKKSGIMKSLMD